jgi:hypothetical protein
MRDYRETKTTPIMYIAVFSNFKVYSKSNDKEKFTINLRTITNVS